MSEKICATDGTPLADDHREIDPATGMQKQYMVLAPEERAKGYVRPLRYSYKHLSCNSETRMNSALAETYARNPQFYSGTFCVLCRKHFPLDQFVWVDDGKMVGS